MIKILRIISLVIVILFILLAWYMDYDKIDCYLHADSQSNCTPQNSYKYKSDE